MRVRETIRRFERDKRGNFAVLFGAAASVLALAAGFAVDTAQLYSVESKLQQALDAAITSTARDLTTGRIKEADARAAVEAFFSVNAEGMLAGAAVLDTLAVDRQANTIDATAHVDAALFFPLFRGGDTRRIGTRSAAVYSDKTIEVAMMLDITGSMKGQKIEDLKAAAKNAATAFLAGQDPANPRVRVAVVPYADAVNVGALARYVHYETRFATGEPPVFSGLTSVSLTDQDIDRLPDGTMRADRCATDRKGALRFSDAGPASGMVSRDVRLDPRACPAAVMQPLTGDLGRITAAIDGIRADGLTAGHIGIQWSWYMLSPSWATVLPASAAPSPYGSGRTAKYAILMTDGEFNTAYAGVPQGENVRNQPVRSRASAERLCEEMRKDGIEVFTIGFMLKEANAKRVMRACASPDTSSVQHYFDVSTGEALDQAYQQIARNIERLAITK
ncbi:MAG: hypothetical protein KF723_18160 [Rhizobiaceae bacterium]|nr:hypothetical protein [Rhizobiaceae bacterium]